jgi:hypothetical protein
VNNNPLSLVDPTGFYCPQEPGADETMCIYGSGRIEYAPFAVPFQSVGYGPSNNFGWGDLTKVDAAPMNDAFYRGTLSAAQRYAEFGANSSALGLAFEIKPALAVGLMLIGMFDPSAANAPPPGFRGLPSRTGGELALSVGLPVAFGIIGRLGGTTGGNVGDAAKVDEVLFGGNAQPPESIPTYQEGGRTRGWLDTGRAFIELWSGREGGPPALPLPGRNNLPDTHVEAHTAQIMRVENLRNATLWINRVPCGSANGCAAMLKDMLPEGAQLRVIGPEGYDEQFTGIPDRPDYP